MKPVSELSVAYVRSILDYDPATGEFRWRERKDVRSEWNTRYAGCVAGSVSPNPGRNTKYRTISINDTDYCAHRLAWLYFYGDWPAYDLDHINGNGLDNRLGNLRLATPQQNGANRSVQANNALARKGVKVTPAGRFSSRIKHSGRSIHIGTFNTANEAHAAYVGAARVLFGDFARAE